MSQDTGYGTESPKRSVAIHLEAPRYLNIYDIWVSHYAKENINGSYFHVRVSAQTEENDPFL